MIWLQGIQGVLCIFEICALFYIFSLFFDRRFCGKKHGVLLVTAIIVLSSITIYQRYIAGMYSRYYLLLISLLFSLLLMVLYKNSFKNILIITLLYFENIYFCDLFLLFFLNNIRHDSKLATYVQQNVSGERIIILLITRAITIAILFLLYKYQADIKRAVFENQNYLGLFTIFEFIALSFCDKIFYPFLQDKVRIYFIIFPVLILSFFVLSIVYIMYFEKKKMLQIMSERILNTKISYQNLILEYRDRDLIYHDLKNHLSLLTSLLEAGDTEKALLYAKTISEPIKVLERKRWSGNIIVDIILNEFYTKAKRNNINTNILCGNLRDCGVSDNDWCIVLLNLLDNALEACEKVEESKRWITITIKCRENIILLEINNSFDGKLQKDRNGKLLTAKQNNFLHGIGLDSVVRIIDKYGGLIQINGEDKVFKVNASMISENYVRRKKGHNE